jgi:hypothetical protein
MVHYDTTLQGVMGWANSELEHIGRIVSLEDPDLAYSYAQSTVYSMAHLKDALFQMVNDDAYEHHKKDLLNVHAKVIKAMKHLIKDFDLDLEAVKAFNTRDVLSNLSYLKNSNTRSNNNKKKNNNNNKNNNNKNSNNKNNNNKNNNNKNSNNKNNKTRRNRH